MIVVEETDFETIEKLYKLFHMDPQLYSQLRARMIDMDPDAEGFFLEIESDFYRLDAEQDIPRVGVKGC